MDKNIHFRPERLKELRKNANMTQKDFSKKIGCTMASLSAYENGSKIPPTQTLMNIADTFKCSIDWLLGLREERDYRSTTKSIRTYSEYIKLLFSLQDKGIYLTSGCHCFDSVNRELPFKGISFNDPVISLFLESWKKTRALFDDGTIDSTIYKAWQEKILRDFHHNILASDTAYEEFHNNYSSFSSFTEWTEYEAVLEALSTATGFVTGEPPVLD